MSVPTECVACGMTMYVSPPVKESQCEKCEQNDIMKKALREIDKQTGLMEYLDANEWATAEDYFAHVARKALKEI